MQKVVTLLAVLGLAGLGWFFTSRHYFIDKSDLNLTQYFSPKPSGTAESSASSDQPQTQVLAQGLDTPWALGFLPDRSILFTERPGRLDLLKPDGNVIHIANIVDSKEIGEGGLLGLAVDPAFSNNHFIYLYYTYSSNGSDTLNKVMRFKFENNIINDGKIIVDNIPGSSNHDGGRLKFGPDGALYLTTGDAENPSQAQDTKALGGKILRINNNGVVEVYSYGHRNPQGLAWNNQGELFETEHGPSGGQYGAAHDEFNFIEEGKNYGWPTIIGDQTKEGLVPPLLNSGTDTWAPSGLAYFDNSFFFGGLKGQALYQVSFEGGPKLNTYLKGEFGRIRDVVLGPDEMLYITTSNKDGRGNPKEGDDKIIRVNPEKL